MRNVQGYHAHLAWNNSKLLLNSFFNSQVDLPTDIMGLAGVAKAAGYEAVYKGKVHWTNFNARVIKNQSKQSRLMAYGWNR